MVDEIIDNIIRDYPERDKIYLHLLEYDSFQKEEKRQLQQLLDNADKLKIKGVCPDSHLGTPTLLIELGNWSIVEASPFKLNYDDNIVFE